MTSGEGSPLKNIVRKEKGLSNPVQGTMEPGWAVEMTHHFALNVIQSILRGERTAQEIEQSLIGRMSRMERFRNDSRLIQTPPLPAESK